MVFMCQRDSFLKEFQTTVASCEFVEDPKDITRAGIDKTVEEGNKVCRVILDDTILFPEGGGQPDDRGTINNLEVIRSERKADKALHYVFVKKETNTQNGEGSPTDACQLPFKVGESVSTAIDWERRFDHMQQHSGQHLVTAIADSLFGFPTTSWWLGSEDSFIELDTLDITQEQISKIEYEANLRIREGVNISVDVVELDDPKLKTARGRNLPEDVKGQIRIVTMSGIESNVCCGTHVSNLSQLQVVKLLQVVKKKGKCLLHFLCGNRVIHRFTEQFQREQQLMGILKSSPQDFCGASEKLNVALKNLRKTCQVLSKELAVFEAKSLKAKVDGLKLVTYHRDNADLDFANALLREIGPVNDYVLLITIKAEGNSGHMMLLGGDLDKDRLVNLGESICEVLDGKGNVRGNMYQAKINKVTNVKKAVKLAQDLLESC